MAELVRLEIFRGQLMRGSSIQVMRALHEIYKVETQHRRRTKFLDGKFHLTTPLLYDIFLAMQPVTWHVFCLRVQHPVLGKSFPARDAYPLLRAARWLNENRSRIPSEVE